MLKADFSNYLESFCPGFSWTLNETYTFVHKRNPFPVGRFPQRVVPLFFFLLFFNFFFNVLWVVRVLFFKAMAGNIYIFIYLFGNPPLFELCIEYRICANINYSQTSYLLLNVTKTCLRTQSFDSNRVI